MAIMMIMEWEGVTAQQYDDVRAEVGWLRDAPVGGRVHVAAATETGLRITDVWDSAEDFQHFVDARLMPAVEKLGIPGQPEVEVLPLHELFCPRPEDILTT